MSDKTSQRVESSKRQWSRMWSHVLAAILIIAASVIANFSYERVSERPQLVFGVLVIFAGIVAALTLIVAKVRERDAPARRLKDSVRTAYSSALSLTGNQLVEGGPNA